MLKRLLSFLANILKKKNLDNLYRDIFYPNKAGTIIVRRPFKYLKHQGPRPVGANLGFMFTIHVANGSGRVDCTEKVCRRILPPRAASRMSKCEDPCSSVHGLKANQESRAETSANTRLKKNEAPYGPPFSRLLSSRKLNLTALDLSACRKRKSVSQMPAMRDGQQQSTYIEPNQVPGTARPSAWLRSSHFSDWSNSAPASSCPSAAFCDTPTVMGLPATPATRDNIITKKRISSVPRLPLSFNNNHPNPFPNSRSRSDFGLPSYS